MVFRRTDHATEISPRLRICREWLSPVEVNGEEFEAKVHRTLYHHPMPEAPDWGLSALERPVKMIPDCALLRARRHSSPAYR